MILTRIHPTARNRSGFTLLEVLLSSAIGIMLLGALYVSFDVTVRQTEAGREAVERGDLARAVINRMTIDLSGALGPLQPKSGGGLPDQSTTSSSSSTSTSSSSSSTTSSSTDSSDSSSSSSTTSETTEATAADVPFQGGVFGNDKQVTLFVSRVPPTLSTIESLTSTTAIDSRPDLRRVTYYVGVEGGLCRQERSWVTSDGVRNSTDPDPGEELYDLISDEVIDATFEYFDGGGWTTEWMGSDAAADGSTPLGPPRAIRVTLMIQPGGISSSAAVKQVVHVIPIRAAVGLYLPPIETTSADATSAAGGM